MCVCVCVSNLRANRQPVNQVKQAIANYVLYICYMNFHLHRRIALCEFVHKYFEYSNASHTIASKQNKNKNKSSINQLIGRQRACVCVCVYARCSCLIVYRKYLEIVWQRDSWMAQCRHSFTIDVVSILKYKI